MTHGFLYGDGPLRKSFMYADQPTTKKLKVTERHGDDEVQAWQLHYNLAGPISGWVHVY